MNIGDAGKNNHRKLKSVNCKRSGKKLDFKYKFIDGLNGMMKNTSIMKSRNNLNMSSDSSSRSLQTYEKLVGQRRSDDKLERQAKLKAKIQKQEEFRNEIREQIKAKQK